MFERVLLDSQLLGGYECLGDPFSDFDSLIGKPFGLVRIFVLRRLRRLHVSPDPLFPLMRAVAWLSCPGCRSGKRHPLGS